MKLKKLLAMVICVAMVLGTIGVTAFAADNELYVSSDYNSSTEGYGVTRFSNYAGAYAYAVANNTSATIVVEKTTTLSGNTFDDSHENYSKLAVVIKDGAAMGNALSKWDMTYPVTVEAGGTLTCARPASASVSNIHIKNKLIIGTKGSDKKAYCYLLSDSYQDCDISIRYNGSIEVYNAEMTVQDLDAQGRLTVEDSMVTVDGAFASATFFATTLTDSTLQVNGTQISGGLSDFAGGTSNQLGNVTLKGDSSIEFGEGSTVKVAANVTLNDESSITADNMTINSGKKIAVNGTSSVTVDTLTNNGTIAAVSGAEVTAATVADGSTGKVTVDGTTAEFDENGKAFIPVAQIGDVTYTSLQSAIDAATDGAIVNIIANIVDTDGVIITDKNLTIDFGGKTYKVTEGASTNNRNIKVNGNSVVTIKNGTLIAAGDYSSGTYGTVRAEGTANVTLEDLTLYNYRGNGLNIKTLGGTTVKISDTKIYSEYGGGIESAGGVIELTNVEVYQKGMYTAPYNSMAISVNGGGTVTVNSGYYETIPLAAEDAYNQGSSHGSWAAGVLNSGGTLIINDGTFVNGNFGEDSLATAARGLLLADTGANIQVNGGTFKALKAIIDYQNNIGDAAKNPVVTLKGGTYSAVPTSSWVTLPDGYETLVNEDGTYTVEKAWDGVTITNLAQLKRFRDAVNAGDTYAGKTVSLKADIDLGNEVWTPIGAKEYVFSGTFDGEGHIISNLKFENAETSYVGLFGYTTNVVKNVNVNNVTLTGKSYVGAISGCGYTGTIENCQVTGKINISGNYMVGGITGHGYARIADCHVIGAEANENFIKGIYKEGNLEGDNVGGIVGHNAETNSIKNCTVKNVLVSGTRKVGGIVGITAQNGDVINCAVENITVETTATAEYAADNAKTMSIGGIIGQYQSAGSNDGEVTDCQLNGVTFNNANNVNVSIGALSGGLRGSSGSTVQPADTITASNNTIVNVNGTNVKYLEPVIVAKIGDVEFTSLQTAIDAATESAEIDIVADIELDEGITIGADKVITIDLNGYIVSQTKAQTAGYQMILNDGNLTINDSVGTGKISYTDSGVGGEYISDTIYNRAVLVINGGTIENLSSETVADNGYPHAVDTYSGIRDTSVTVNGGTIYCASYSAMRMFCVSETKKADLVINDGIIKGSVDIQNGSKDKACLGSFTVNGGTFEKNQSKNNVRVADWHYYGSTATISGISVAIKSGTFDAGIYNNIGPVTKFVSGGTFGTDVTEFVADGYEVKANENGTFGVIEEAVVEEVPDMTGDVINVTASNAQNVLDGKYGDITGKTINFTENITEVLDLARTTKYAGSGTQYVCSNGNSHSNESKSFTDVTEFLEHYGENEWHTTPNYYRTLSNVTFTADEGVTVAGFAFSAGHVYANEKTGPVYDYVKEVWTEVGSAYYDYRSLNGITFKGLTVTGHFDAMLYIEGSTVKNITFDGCTFTGTTDDEANAAIKFLADSQYFTNVVVENCVVDGYYQGVYISGIDGATISKNNINNTVHNAIALQSNDAGNPAKGTVVVKENYISNVTNRAIRFNYVGDADIAINNNIMVNCGNSAGELIAAVSVADETVVDLEANYWDGKDVSTAVASFTAPETIGVTGGTWDIDIAVLATYIADGAKISDNGTVYMPVAKIGNVEYKTLAEALGAAADGDTVVLLNDIELSGTVIINKNITIDGGENTITPADDFVSDGNGAAVVFENTTGAAAVKNITFDGFDGLARVVRANFAEIAVEGCTFNNNNVTEGIITSAYADLTVDGCAFNNNDSGFAVINIGSDVSSGTDKVANITNNTFVENNATIAVVFAASSVNVTSNSFSGNIHTGDNANAAAILAGPYTGNMSYTININENAFVNAMSKGEAALPAVFAEDWSSLGSTTAFDLSSNYWNGGEPADGYATSGENPDVTLDDYYTTYVDGVLGGLEEIDNAVFDGTNINNLEDLKAFRDSVNAGETYAGKTVVLNTSINLNNEAWTPIGTKAAQFKGTFDGQNNTISNLYINDGDLEYAGLFGYASSAKINNVKINNVDIYAYSHVGSVVGSLYTGSASNCHVSGTIRLVSQYAYAGGITGYGYNNIYDCSVIATERGIVKVNEKTGAGGIVGWHTEGNLGIYRCTAKNLDITAWTNLGGITGFIHYENTVDGCAVENVTLTKTRIDGQAGIGLVAGGWSNKADDNYVITITNNTLSNITMDGTAINSHNQLYGSNYSYYDKVIKLNDGSDSDAANSYSEIVSNVKVVVNKEADLEKALAYCNEGETIYFGSDFEISIALKATNNVTLDLSGKNITFAEGGAIELAEIGATLAGPANLNVITSIEGAEVEYADGVYTVVEKAAEEEKINSKNAYIKNIETTYEGNPAYKVILMSGIDSLEYQNVGFKFTVDGKEYEYFINKVFKTATAKNSEGETVNITPKETFGDEMNYIFGESFYFGKDKGDKSLVFTPFATKLNGTVIYGKTTTINKIFDN